MKVERIPIPACCGKKVVVFKTDKILSQIHLDLLSKAGFVIESHFAKAGILYVQNNELIVTGPLGSNRLQISCRKDNCKQAVDMLELVLKSMG